MKGPKMGGLPCSLGLGEADSYVKCFPKDQKPGTAEKGIRKQKPELSPIIRLARDWLLASLMKMQYQAHQESRSDLTVDEELQRRSRV